jgi:hypothetical protein
MFSDLFENVKFLYIFLSSILFIAGIYFAPVIVDKNIHWLLVYPRWIAKLMEKYFSTRWGFITIFLIILILNNFSLFFGFISGFTVIFPLILAFFTGFHVAVIGYDLMGWQGIWHLLVNPVAWLEFPASWISFGMGLRLSAELINTGSLNKTYILFKIMLPLYFKYVFVLLLIAGLLESGMIIWVEKNKDKFNSK